MEINLQNTWELVFPWSIKIVSALVIFLVGLWISKRLSRKLAEYVRRFGKNELLVNLARNIAYVALLLVFALAALNQLGINTASALAVFGAAGLAIGLAVKDSLSNVASGVLIAVFKPFEIGHYIEAGGTSGTVVEVGLFNTDLLSPDNRRIIIPNSVVYNGVIVNYSAEDTRRIDLVFGIGYDDDYLKACELIAGVLAADTRILKQPESVIAMGELADSSVNVLVRPWVKNQEYWNVRFSLIRDIKQKFDENGISIPFPQRDVHMYPSTPLS